MVPDDDLGSEEIEDDVEYIDPEDLKEKPIEDLNYKGSTSGQKTWEWISQGSNPQNPCVMRSVSRRNYSYRIGRSQTKRRRERLSNVCRRRDTAVP